MKVKCLSLGSKGSRLRQKSMYNAIEMLNAFGTLLLGCLSTSGQQFVVEAVALEEVIINQLDPAYFE